MSGQCGSEGGRGIGAGHTCICIRRVGHPADSPRPHGCSCGAMWADEEVSRLRQPHIADAIRARGAK